MRCSTRPESVRRICLTLGLVLLAVAAKPAQAGRILDYIRNYDLNDYSLGVAVAVSQSPYTNASNSVIIYPYLTSFNHQAFTDDWLMLNDGELGVRRVFQSGWEYGAVGRVQTLSLGAERPDELQGLFDREWALELAPFVGYRGWPVQFRYKPFKEITGRHGGWEHNFQFLYPIERQNGFIIPSIIVSHMDDDYTDYYFQVTEPESRPGRPVYDPGAATNIMAQLRIGYRVWDKWLLNFRVAYELLDDEIVNSPIVDKDGTWSGSVGLAYNADIFQPREFDQDIGPIPRLAVRAGVFQNHVTTTVRRKGDDGIWNPPYEIGGGIADNEDDAAYQLDAVLRVGHFHRLEFGAFDFTTQITGLLEEPVTVGDTRFEGGTNLVLKSSLRITRLGYSYSLMHDAQKELAFMGGIHNTKLSTDVFSPDTGETVRATASSPMPVIGANGSITLTPKTKLAARLNFYAMDFEQYEGNMSSFDVAVEHRLWDMLSMGIGYHYYRLKLESDTSNLAGRITTKQHGPFLFLGLHF